VQGWRQQECGGRHRRFNIPGITGLVNGVYNKAQITLVILDNGTTAMTGHQEHPGTGVSAQGKEMQKVELEQLVRGIGVKEEAASGVLWTIPSFPSSSSAVPARCGCRSTANPEPLIWRNAISAEPACCSAARQFRKRASSYTLNPHCASAIAVPSASSYVPGRQSDRSQRCRLRQRNETSEFTDYRRRGPGDYPGQ